MGIKKYFRNERYKQYIICSLPVIISLLLARIQVEPKAQKSVEKLYLSLWSVYFLFGIGLISFYVYSYMKFIKKLSLFNQEELERINKEAETSYNFGKILITNDVVIYYSFFRKKVVPTSIIKDVKKEEGTYIGSRGLKIDYHNIILICKDDKREIIYGPKNYNNTECESCRKIIKDIINNRILNHENCLDINALEAAGIFKYYKEFRLSSIMDFIIIIPYVLICLLINRAFNNSSDFVLKTFFKEGIEDFIIYIELVLYTIIFVIINIYFKFHNKYIVKGNKPNGLFKATLLFVLLFLNWIFIETNYEDKKDVQSDFACYLINECKTYTGKISYSDDINYYDVSCTDYKVYEKEKEIHFYADEKEFKSTEENIDENTICRITYLPKTHFIVNIKEVIQ